MTNRHRHLPIAGVLLAVIVFLASGCVPAPTPTPMPTREPAPKRVSMPTRTPVPTDKPYTEAITRAVAFLEDNYNPNLGLIRESPETAPNRYWLATDNWLAVHALRAAGEHERADNIQATIAEYDPSNGGLLHGVIEVLEGEDIGWPPSTPDKGPVKEPIYVERRNTDAIMRDWQEYADLAFYGVLDATIQVNVRWQKSGTIRR